MSRYDQWATREPPWSNAPDYTWEMQPHCQVCGCWLKLQPDKVTFEEDTEHCDGVVHGELGAALCGKSTNHGPHDFVVWGWSISHRRCRRCGYVNEEAE